MYQVEEYQTSNGRQPFREWLGSIRDPAIANRIELRLARVRAGHLGDYRDLGKGICELRLAFGPGYRIYFARTGPAVLLLLAGGSKASQSSDIRKARMHHEDFLRATIPS